jgi:hypothetical protein
MFTAALRMGLSGKDKKQQKPAVYRRALTGTGWPLQWETCEQGQAAVWSLFPGPRGRRGIIAVSQKPAVAGTICCPASERGSAGELPLRAIRPPSNFETRTKEEGR